MNKIVLGIEGGGKSSTAMKLAEDANPNFTYVNARLPMVRDADVSIKLAGVLESAQKSGVLVIDDLQALAGSKARKELTQLITSALDNKNITVIIAADHQKFDSMMHLPEYASIAKRLEGAFRHVLPKINQREAKVRRQMRAEGFDLPKGY